MPHDQHSAAYMAGLRLASSVFEPGTNPHPAGSQDAIDWAAGVRDAQLLINDYAEYHIRRDKECSWRDRRDADMNLRGRCA